MLNPMLCSCNHWAFRKKHPQETTDSYIDKVNASREKYIVHEEWFTFIKKTSSSNLIVTLCALWPVLPLSYNIYAIRNPRYYITSCNEFDTATGARSIIDAMECVRNYNMGTLVYNRSSEDECTNDWNQYLMLFMSIALYVLSLMILHYNFVMIKYSLKLLSINVRVKTQELHSAFITLFLIYAIQIALYRFKADQQTCQRNVDGVRVGFNLTMSEGNVWLEIGKFLFMYSCILSLLYKQFTDPFLAYIKLNKLIDSVQHINYPLNAVQYELIRNPIEVHQLARLYYTRYKKTEDEVVILYALILNLIDLKLAREVEYEDDDNSVDEEQAVNRKLPFQRMIVKRKKQTSVEEEEESKEKKEDKKGEVIGQDGENSLTESLVIKC